MLDNKFTELLHDASSANGAWIPAASIVEFLDKCASKDVTVLTVHGYREVDGFRRGLGFQLFGIEPGSMSASDARLHFQRELAGSDTADVIFNIFV